MKTLTEDTLPKRHGAPWLEEEHQLFLLLSARGESAEYIAARLQRTPEAIVYHSQQQQQQDPSIREAKRKSAEIEAQKFERWHKPSKTFTNRWPKICSVCGQKVAAGADAHFVASDKLAHAGCF